MYMSSLLLIDLFYYLYCYFTFSNNTIVPIRDYSDREKNLHFCKNIRFGDPELKIVF